MIEFRATLEQVKQIFCNAINASYPMDPHKSVAMLFKKQKLVTPADIVSKTDDAISIYSYGQKIISLAIIKIGEDKWKVQNSEITEKQTWSHKYTHLTLIASVVGFDNILN